MQIETKTVENSEIVSPIGEIDMGSSNDLREALLKQTKKKAKNIIVDLQEVDYIDSSGLATLIECMQEASGYGGEVRLVINKSDVMGVFELARLDKVFKIFEDIASAQA